MGALIRLASLAYADDKLSTIGEKLTRLCTQELEAHILKDLALLEDDMSAQMRTRSMGAALDAHADKLETVFLAYSAADQGNAASRKQSDTMNVMECHQLIDDCGMYDKKFGTREVLITFVKVNLDDEVYEQEDEDNMPSELVFDEFEEWLARVFGQVQSAPISPLSSPLSSA